MIPGRVASDEEGRPVSGTFVQVRQGDETAHGSTTDAEGRIVTPPSIRRRPAGSSCAAPIRVTVPGSSAPPEPPSTT